MNQATADELYFLAFDHRGEFVRSLFGADVTEPDAHMRATVARAKEIVLDGCVIAKRDSDLPVGTVGVLVDDDYGAGLVPDTKAAGLLLAMPVEVADQRIFELNHGELTAQVVSEFDPDFVKVLVRYNPEDSDSDKKTQTDRLRDLSDWVKAEGRRLMFELVIPPTPEQAQHCLAKREDFSRVLRPALAAAAVRELQAAGIDPAVWKVEGIDDPAMAMALSEQVRADGRANVGIIVLSGAESEQRVRHWLKVAATTPGYRGFAMGRSIWRDPIRDYVAGRCDARTAAERIAKTYTDYVLYFRSVREAVQKSTDL